MPHAPIPMPHAPIPKPEAMSFSHCGGPMRLRGSLGLEGGGEAAFGYECATCSARFSVSIRRGWGLPLREVLADIDATE